MNPPARCGWGGKGREPAPPARNCWVTRQFLKKNNPVETKQERRKTEMFKECAGAHRTESRFKQTRSKVFPDEKKKKQTSKNKTAKSTKIAMGGIQGGKQPGAHTEQKGEKMHNQRTGHTKVRAEKGKRGLISHQVTTC